MKKPIYIYAMALAIAGLMTISATAAVMHPAVSEHSSAKNFSATTVKAATKMAPKFAPTEQKEYALYEANGAQPLSWTWRKFQTPALAEHNGIVAFVGRMVRDDIDIVTWTGSEFDGRKLYNPTAPYDERNFHIWAYDADVTHRWTWYYCIYWIDSNGCYNPTFEYRGMNGTNRVFVGSMVSIDHAVTPPNGHGWNSGDPFVCTSQKYPFFNPNSTGTEVQTSWSGSSWPFSDQGYTNMNSVSIATDPTDTEIEKRFGVLSLVVDGENGSVQGIPAQLFQFNESTGTMSSFNVGPCYTTHCVIDAPGNRVHSVYDCYAAETFQNGLFARMDNYAEMKQYTGSGTLWWAMGYTWTFEDTNLNIANPCVAANNGNVVVVTEVTNATTPDDVDLVAWYTSDGNVSHFETSAIAYSLAAEKHPEIEWAGGNSFVCAFYNNSHVYMSRSNDGGATWSTPTMISGTDNVVDDHGTIDISANAYKITYPYIIDANHWMYRIVRLGTNLYIDTTQIFEGMTTCPAGNEASLIFAHPLVVTVRDANGNPIPGIPAANFQFTVNTEEQAIPWNWPYNPHTQSYGTPRVTFTAIDPQTDANGQIRFSIVGATSIFGNILIIATVNGQTTNNVMRLACKSPDYDTNGAVALGDFIIFGQDFGKTVEYGKRTWRSDFSNDGSVGLSDFIVFGQHWTH